jgi:hypothetical protein
MSGAIPPLPPYASNRSTVLGINGCVCGVCETPLLLQCYQFCNKWKVIKEGRRELTAAGGEEGGTKKETNRKKEDGKKERKKESYERKGVRKAKKK